MQVILDDIYDVKIFSTIYYIEKLYKLLEERLPEENISHKEMPTFEYHSIFVKSKPYAQWFAIITDYDTMVGAAYISKNNEVGIQIFEKFKRRGFATDVLAQLIEISKAMEINLYANINPKNEKSIKLFSKFGFNHIQNTYKRDAI